jgi:CheY-like chemotaxis protein
MATTDKKSGVVLVVDDEPLIRMNAADMLADAGWTAIEAADADEALALLAEHPDVTVLFTDINMPGSMDGLDLARRVHQLRPDVQLVITSGKLRPGRADLPGEGQFIGKPYGERQFISLIEAVSAG